MKVLVNFALVLVLILCFVNIASSYHAQGNVPSEVPIVAQEPMEAIVIPASTPVRETPGYFELLLEQLKTFFIPEANTTTDVEPSASVVEQVVLA